MKILDKIIRIYTYKRIYKNWWNIITQIRRGEKEVYVILNTLNKNNEGICKLPCVIGLISLIAYHNLNLHLFHFKDGNLYYNDNLIIQDSELTVLLSAYGFQKENNYLLLPKTNLKLLIEGLGYSVFEVFVNNIYDTDIQGEVLDIGTNIGDSAIYFAIKGASHVYAFEPLPSIYETALKNVRLNNLEDKITLINAGVSYKYGKIKVPLSIRPEDSLIFSSLLSRGDVEVPLFSFDDIVKNMVKDPYLLKMDCEGCEADIILNSDSISYFEKILVESHPHITKVSDKALLSKLRKLKYKCEERYRVGKTKLFYCSKIN
jgi:FkbM family methyltransferase